MEVVLHNSGVRTLKLAGGLVFDPGLNVLPADKWRAARRDPITVAILARGALRVVELRPASEGGGSPPKAVASPPLSGVGPVDSVVAVAEDPPLKKKRRKYKKRSKKRTGG